MLVAGLFGIAPLGAQEPGIQTGARVRIATSDGGEPMVGWIDATGPGNVRLVRETDHQLVTLHRDEILRIERSRVRRSLGKQIAPGMAAGGVIGLVVGFTLTEEEHCEPQSFLCFDFPEKVFGGMGGALVEMLVGSLVSAVIIPGESWEDASMPALTVNAAPGGASVALRIPLGSGRQP